MGSPLRDTEGQLIGVVALEVSVGRINQIMQERTGMGETGETYLVGTDRRMRSDSYLDEVGQRLKELVSQYQTG